MNALTPEQRTALEAAWREGKGDRETARLTGISSNTVRKYRREMGLPAQPHGYRPAQSEPATASSAPTVRFVSNEDGLPVEVWIDDLCVHPALIGRIAARLAAMRGVAPLPIVEAKPPSATPADASAKRGRGRPATRPFAHIRDSGERYDALRSQGLCGKCERQPAMQGKSRCKDCWERAFTKAPPPPVPETPAEEASAAAEASPAPLATAESVAPAAPRQEQVEAEAEDSPEKSPELPLTAAQKEMVEKNIRLVHFFARRMPTDKMGWDDLIQEGTIGLMRAARTFDPAKGTFATHARFSITGAMMRALSNHGSDVRVPVSAGRKRRELAKGGETDTGDPHRLFHRVGLETPLKADGQSLLDLLEAPTEDPADQIARAALMTTLADVLKTMPPRQAHVIRRRFGLDDTAEMTLADIGKEMDLSKEMIRQIEALALAKLKRKLIQQGVDHG